MKDTVVLGGDWNSNLVIDGDCSLDMAQDGCACPIIAVRDGYPVWPGPTVVTPTQNQQIMTTTGYVMDKDIFIEPIPSCYGLVTWNGSVLTIT